MDHEFKAHESWVPPYRYIFVPSARASMLAQVAQRRAARMWASQCAGKHSSPCQTNRTRSRIVAMRHVRIRAPSVEGRKASLVLHLLLVTHRARRSSSLPQPLEECSREYWRLRCTVRSAPPELPLVRMIKYFRPLSLCSAARGLLVVIPREGSAFPTTFRTVE